MQLSQRAAPTSTNALRGRLLFPQQSACHESKRGLLFEGVIYGIAFRDRLCAESPLLALDGKS